MSNLIERLNKHAHGHELTYGHTGICGEAAATITTLLAECEAQLETINRQADLLAKAGRQLKEEAARAEKLESLLRRIEPHLDAIVCYASDMGEHEPNRIAFDVRQTLGSKP
jgi:thiamine pyrophosphate-dependent acetolactate synthase large subunit-like protein